MNRLLLVALVSLAAVPAVAFAAAKPGSYSGTSSAKYIQVGSPTLPTDKGKVTFAVRKNKVRNFKLRRQQMACGAGPVVPVTVKTIKLNSKGKGSKTLEVPDVGYLTVKVKVTSAGKASGTIRKPSNKPGLCNPSYPVRFTAKPK